LKYLLLLLLTFSSAAFCSSYAGGSFGNGGFSSVPLKEYNLAPIGTNYGFFVGKGKDVVGLEGFYTLLTGAGKVKNDGTEYDITTNANVRGATQ
jgi:hypothetical protein